MQELYQILQINKAVIIISYEPGEPNVRKKRDILSILYMIEPTHWRVRLGAAFFGYSPFKWSYFCKFGTMTVRFCRLKYTNVSYECNSQRDTLSR
jgi:hypothetical protein